ncbi:MAG TPA: pirin family protein [Acidothermaceae bacterium]
MSRIAVITSRTVPLGGPRAMTVRRTLPQRARSLIGAWCFIDHYGPDDVATTGGMDVPPHPHTGLQTVSWLFAGSIEHRDSGGVRALIKPGELNLMTAGSGVAHSEVSTTGTTQLHGVQLWIALPDAARDIDRAFAHHVPELILVSAGTIRVMIGTLAGHRSPVPTHSPLVGAEITLQPTSALDLDVDATFEHGVLVDHGAIEMDGTRLSRAELGYRPPGSDHLRLTNPGTAPARLMLIGGEPFTEPLLMWWNFVGRSHDEIVQFREEWQAASDRFGTVDGYRGRIPRLPAPLMPNARLRPRLTPPGPRDPSAWG